MSKQTISSRMLLHLNTEPLHIAKLTEYLYGAITEKTLSNTKSLTQNACNIGWEIVRDNSCFTISQKHYDLLLECDRLLENWSRLVTMTPEAVERAVSEYEMRKCPVSMCGVTSSCSEEELMDIETRNSNWLK